VDNGVRTFQVVDDLSEIGDIGANEIGVPVFGRLHVKHKHIVPLFQKTFHHCPSDATCATGHNDFHLRPSFAGG
jgi:hypothetical protein